MGRLELLLRKKKLIRNKELKILNKFKKRIDVYITIFNEVKLLIFIMNY